MIRISEDQKLITLETLHSTYQMKIDQYGFLLHLYYGIKISGDASILIVPRDHGFSGNPYDAGNDRTYSLDHLPQEYSVYGGADYRSTLFSQKATASSSQPSALVPTARPTPCGTPKNF